MSRLYTMLSMLMLCAVAVCAQSLHTTDAASDYDRGYTMYCDGNYAGCYDVMSALLQREDASQYHEEAAFYVVMSQAKRGVKRTPELLARYLWEYPYSLHHSEINLELGYYYYNEGEYSKAVDELLKIDLNSINGSEQDDYAYRLAMSYIHTRQYDKAQPLLRALVQNSAQYGDAARYYSGYIYYDEGDYDNARRNLTQVHSNSEYLSEARYLLLNIDFVNKQYAQCVASCDPIINSNIGEAYRTELYRIAGESHYQLGNDEQAMSYISRYLDTADTPYRTTLYIAGILSYRAKEYDKSIELLNRVVGEDDHISQNAYLHKGLAYLQADDMHNAYEAFTCAAESRCDDAIREIALYNQALCAYDAKPNLFDSTLALFENFIREYPHSRYTDDVNSRISELHLSSRNYSDALDYINRIKQPSHDILKQRQQILYMLGTEAFANNRISEAGKWFEQAANAGDYAPEYQVRSVYWLGECRYRNGSYTEALQCYRQVAASNIIADDAMVALAQYNMGYCYFRTKKYSSAGSAFELFVQNKLATTPLLIDAYSRIGDCYFQARKYTAAEKYYARAADYKGGGSDYALLQQAVVTGVSKNYKQKVSLLKQFIKQYPRSEYNAEAYNELAQTYISLGDNAQSIATYNRLVELFPESVLTRNAMLQLGALYYNQRDMNSSISAYKKLIVQHPTSGEAKVAIEDLKSIYIELNQVDELSQFMQQQGIDYHRAELDSLTYMAAERKYMTAGDVSSLKNYTTQFPHGAYRATAYYYMGNVADVEQKYDEALEYYLNSLQVDPHSNFAEEALARTGDILYDMEQYQRAATQYTLLEQKAASPELRLNAAVGALRCYVRLQQHREAIDVANRILTHSKVSPEVEQEVYYHRAQSYRAEGDVDNALADFTLLAQDTRTLYGAEAAYLIAQHYFDNNRMDKAENAANDFVQKGTQHAYWLARNFILLADIYAAKDDNYTARQYLLQLRDNYPGSNDDIATLIEKRLVNL